jgi:hypothetical protein
MKILSLSAIFPAIVKVKFSPMKLPIKAQNSRRNCDDGIDNFPYGTMHFLHTITKSRFKAKVCAWCISELQSFYMKFWNQSNGDYVRKSKNSFRKRCSCQTKNVMLISFFALLQ